jgi:hypothetical protein
VIVNIHGYSVHRINEYAREKKNITIIPGDSFLFLIHYGSYYNLEFTLYENLVAILIFTVWY